MTEWRDDVREVTGEVGWTLGKVFFKVIIPLIILSCVVGGIPFSKTGRYYRPNSRLRRIEL